jgi:hypothetical protein
MAIAPSANVLLIADRSEAVIQPGQPSASMGTWILPIPTGSNAAATAASFAATQGFPVGTNAYVIDLSATPLTIAEFTLTASWQAAT